MVCKRVIRHIGLTPCIWRPHTHTHTHWKNSPAHQYLCIDGVYIFSIYRKCFSRFRSLVLLCPLSRFLNSCNNHTLWSIRFLLLNDFGYKFGYLILFIRISLLGMNLVFTTTVFFHSVSCCATIRCVFESFWNLRTRPKWAYVWQRLTWTRIRHIFHEIGYFIKGIENGQFIKLSIVICVRHNDELSKPNQVTNNSSDNIDKIIGRLRSGQSGREMSHLLGAALWQDRSGAPKLRAKRAKYGATLCRQVVELFFFCQREY